MEAVEDALEDTLGTDTKVLILKILKTTYKLDNVACNLEHFEELLARFLGTHSARVVKDRVILELRKEVSTA